MFKGIESLEERRMLSVSLNSTTHTLTITTGNGADSVALALANAGKTLTTKVDGVSKSFTAAAVTKLVIKTGDGNDKVTIAPNIADAANIDAGAGNDVVHSGAGNDTIFGGSGNDLLDGGTGHDVIWGGAGVDTADYSARLTNVTVKLDNLANDGAAGEGDNVESDVENVNGGAGNDMLVGSNVNNALAGNGGNDTIIGNGGNDTETGGAGNDNLEGDAGNDTMDGGAGSDTENGGIGNDTEIGGTGDDTLDGGAGNDTEIGGDGNDVEVGGDGNDTESGGVGADTISGNNNDDNLSGGAGNDLLNGGAGNNVLSGGAGSDDFQGAGGQDTVTDRGSDDSGEDDGGEGIGHGANAFGTVASVDTVNNTITVNTFKEDAASTPTTFKVDPAATITVDGNAVTLGSLTAGVHVFLQTATGDPTTVTSIAAIGGRTEGTVSAVDLVANTITLQGEDGGPARVFTVAPTAVISVNGVTSTLAGVTVGADAKLQLSALSPTTAVKVSVGSGDGEGNGGGGDGGGGDGETQDNQAEGAIASVDAANRKITVNVTSEDGPAQPVTFTVDPAAVITVDGSPATLGSLPAGVKVVIQTSSTDSTVATSITAVGGRAQGLVSAVDTGAGTISLKSDGGQPDRMFTVAPGAKITLNGASATLANVVVGSNVKLQLSALSATTAIAITAGGGDHGGGDGD